MEMEHQAHLENSTNFIHYLQFSKRNMDLMKIIIQAIYAWYRINNVERLSLKSVPFLT